MPATPTADQPAFAAEEPEHCRDCRRLSCDFAYVSRLCWSRQVRHQSHQPLGVRLALRWLRAACDRLAPHRLVKRAAGKVDDSAVAGSQTVRAHLAEHLLSSSSQDMDLTGASRTSAGGGSRS